MKFTMLAAVWGLCLLSLGCRDGRTILVPDNDAPAYDGVPTIKVEAYVNRLYIDLLGREPTDAETRDDIETLREAELSEAARAQLIERLQWSTDFIPGDSSYRHAYTQRFYEQLKARLIEGYSDAEILSQAGIFRGQAYRDSLAGNIASYERQTREANRLRDIVTSRVMYRKEALGLSEMFARMLENWVYDQINMNSINFIRASFNDLFDRFHTQAEFDASFPIIEYNQPGVIFGKAATNKTEYLAVLTQSREFYEAQVRWVYQTLLARDAESYEVAEAMPDFYQTGDITVIQREIMAQAEYAGF